MITTTDLPDYPTIVRALASLGIPNSRIKRLEEIADEDDLLLAELVFFILMDYYPAGGLPAEEDR